MEKRKKEGMRGMRGTAGIEAGAWDVGTKDRKANYPDQAMYQFVVKKKKKKKKV